MNEAFVVILFYKYGEIDNPDLFAKEQRELCSSLGLTGRILIAREGINGTLEGTGEKIREYCERLKEMPLFHDLDVKQTAGTGNAFPKLTVKVRSEIVTSGFGELSDAKERITGKYLRPEELKSWIERGEKFRIVDMRNDYEQKSGYFENSILSGVNNFRDIPKFLPKIKNLAEEKIVTVCTGGVRCEKASGYLMENGFKDVYQLEGGIHRYMEKYPNEDFKGKLYVFDGRILVGFNDGDPQHEVVGRCEKCGAESENYVNCAYNECHRHYISCEDCVKMAAGFCDVGCRLQNTRLIRLVLRFGRTLGIPM